MSTVDPDKEGAEVRASHPAGTSEDDARPLTGEPVAPMRLRPEPPRVTRLSRRVIVGLTAAIGRADAAIAEAQAQLEQARKEARRDLALGDLVATEAREQNVAKVRTAEAALARATADRNVAMVDMQRTEIRATVAGTVTNLDIHPGDYLAAGAQAMALVDTASLRIEGYFEETKLHNVAIGDRARIRLMGDDGEILGHVESIAAAIADDQRDDSRRNRRHRSCRSRSLPSYQPRRFGGNCYVSRPRVGAFVVRLQSRPADLLVLSKPQGGPCEDR